MNPVDASVIRLFLSQHGVASREQLRHLAVSDSRIGDWLNAGALSRVQPSVLQLGGTQETLEQRLAAICLAAPTAVVGGFAAGRLWGFRQMPLTDPLVLIPDGRKPNLQRVQLWRTRCLPDHHVVQRDDAIRVTAPHRTLLELAWQMQSDDQFRACVANVRDRHPVSLRLLHQLKRESAVQGRPGSARFNRVLALESGSNPPQSLPELQIRDALIAAGLHAPVHQFAFDLPRVGSIRADLAYPHERVIIEFDHSEWHAYGKQIVGRDKRRDRALVALGWIVLRFDEDDLALCLDDVIAEIALVLRQRASAA
jgi:Protein of unknown function (DUF559)